MKLTVKEDDNKTRARTEEDTFKKYVSRIGKTVEIDNLPSGLPKVSRKWRGLFTDVQLALEKQFTKEYSLTGSKEKKAEVIASEGDLKQVRLSTIYFPYRIIYRDVIESKFKNERDGVPNMIEYRNKFVPYDRRDFQLLAMQLFQDRALLGPCRVIDLSHLYREDFGEVLGKTNPERTRAVMEELKVPFRDSAPEPDTPSTNSKGDKLTQHQRDLFDTGSDKDSINLQLAKPSETARTVDKIDKLENRAHKVRVTLLAIQRTLAALANAKDSKKRANLKKGLRKLVNYKKKILDKK